MDMVQIKQKIVKYFENCNPLKIRSVNAVSPSANNSPVVRPEVTGLIDLMEINLAAKKEGTKQRDFVKGNMVNGIE